ncbi:MAG: hypothetical protein LBC85_06725 [Fibromonadaceae bacterium]|jgi:hypothetical protein|nr:hypothetical protein [Fibromonadaceae bacterium]
MKIYLDNCCFNRPFDLLESEQFIHILLSQPFDYTEWRKQNLCIGMSVEEISNAAVEYCSRTTSLPSS